MKPKDKKDQQLQAAFADSHLYVKDKRDGRKMRKFWKKERSKYLRREGKKEIDE